MVATGNPRVSVEIANLASYDEVLALHRRFGERRPLHGLVNCAAEVPRVQQFIEIPSIRSGSKVSVDRQFASNVLGYHFMLRAFQDNLRFGCGRVVNVASDWAGNLDLDDVSFLRRSYDNDT